MTFTFWSFCRLLPSAEAAGVHTVAIFLRRWALNPLPMELLTPGPQLSFEKIVSGLQNSAVN